MKLFFSVHLPKTNGGILQMTYIQKFYPYSIMNVREHGITCMHACMLLDLDLLAELCPSLDLVDDCDIAQKLGLQLDQEARDLCNRHQLCYTCVSSPKACYFVQTIRSEYIWVMVLPARDEGEE